MAFKAKPHHTTPHSEETKKKISLSKLGSVPWNKGKSYKSKPCSDETKIKISQANKGKVRTQEQRKKYSEWQKGRKHSLETRKKMRESAKKGKDNHFWKGGATAIIMQIRNCFKNRQWRSDVFTRDNFTCQQCGDNKGGNLEAHHIKQVSIILKEHNINKFENALNCEKLWNINNGVTLCKKCHKKITIIYA